MYQYSGTILGIEAGDTINVDIDLGFKVHKVIKVKLAEVNMPEAQERKKSTGHIASTFLMSMIPPGTTVKLRSEKEQDRYAAWVYVSIDGSDLNINKEMIKSGYATGAKQ